VLLTAVTAGLLATPLRFLWPAPARAATTTVVACLQGNSSLLLAVFQECVRQPQSAFDLYGQAIQSATSDLATARGARRQRLLGIIDRSTKGRERALRQIEACNFQLVADLQAGREACRNPQAAGGSGGGGAGGGGANNNCDPTQEIQCGDLCCNATGSPECCLCPKTARYQCCANGSNCTCCG
jgi:hypothetical protein